MNDTLTLVLAVAILAAGGFGLYMYKDGDIKDLNDSDSDTSEDSDSSEDSYNEDDYADEVKPKSKNNKTKRKRVTGGTKRKY